MASQVRTSLVALVSAVVVLFESQIANAPRGNEAGVSPSLLGVPALAAQAPDEKPPVALARGRILATPVDGQLPAALRKPPTRLALEAYELTPATFHAWKDYVLGAPRDRLWQRIAWRTTLWDAVVDAHEQNKPILLEIHGGNALGRC